MKNISVARLSHNRYCNEDDNLNIRVKFRTTHDPGNSCRLTNIMSMYIFVRWLLVTGIFYPTTFSTFLPNANDSSVTESLFYSNGHLNSQRLKFWSFFRFNRLVRMELCIELLRVHSIWKLKLTKTFSNFRNILAMPCFSGPQSDNLFFGVQCSLYVIKSFANTCRI